MKSEKLLQAIGNIQDEFIESGELPETRPSHNLNWIRAAVLVACVCIVPALLLVLNKSPENPMNPLVITVYAQDEDGRLIPNALSVGEKVKLSPATSPYAEDFEGYAFDLTLLDAKYVSPCAVDENWKPKLYPGDSSLYLQEGFHWSLTEGNDIMVVWPDSNGNIIQEDALLRPKPHGSEIVWRPNNVGLSRTTIGVYDDSFQLLCTYYLEITEDSGAYYAQIVKVE